jgi:hypothetical protein
MAYIAARRNREQKQFKEIWQELRQEYGIEIISEREVGLLHRRIEALLVGSQVRIDEVLAAATTKYGQLIMTVDALQPDGGGPKLYVLYEVLSNTLVSLAMIDQANESNLTEWLKPYQKWQGVVKATLSDKEKALVKALKATWPEAVHQLCQMHFVKDLSEPVHKADRELQKGIREAMGQLAPVPRAKEAEDKTDDLPVEMEESAQALEESSQGGARPALAVVQVIDLISRVELDDIDQLSPAEWIALLPETTGKQDKHEEVIIGEETIVAPDTVLDLAQSPVAGVDLTYLSAQETVTWVNQVLLAQVPASVRVLVETPPCKEAVSYWEHTWYRRAIQDARWLGSRKPFLCGGLRGYDQLQAIADHLAARQAEQGLDPYLTQLCSRVQRAVEQTRLLAADVRQAMDWVICVERLLADSPQATDTRPASAIQKQRMEKLLDECREWSDAGPTLLALQATWQKMNRSWGPDLYHCYDFDGLPRSNLGLEALFGDARRQQRRLGGQADTSPLTLAGQSYLRATSADQGVLLEQFRQVPTWIYRLARKCVDAMAANVRWTRQLHRNTAKSLRQLDTLADTLRQRLAKPPGVAPATYC